MNHMQRIVQEVSARELSKLASATDSIFDKVACGLSSEGLFSFVQALPPSNINEIRELAGQYLHSALMRQTQEEEMHASPEEFARKQMDDATSAMRSRLDFMRNQKELKEAMLEAAAQTGAMPDNPATMAAAQMPGTQIGPQPPAGQPPAGAPPQAAAGKPAAPQLPGSPMEAMGM
jgi:hypothetical protein